MKERLWHGLLQLRRAILDSSFTPHYFHLRSDGQVATGKILPQAEGFSDTFIIISDYTSAPFRLRPGATIFSIKNKFELQLLQRGQLSEEQFNFLSTYIPYTLLPLYAEHEKRAITVAHFAQSLDGRIATCNGDSKWIGNTENLVHAHRMRALCDGVLIGSGTLKCDQPRLTVRHVPGENPVRIILGRPAPAPDYQSLHDSCPEGIVVIGAEKSQLNGKVCYLHLPAEENGRICSRKVLRCLYQRGIRSVYLEGGPTTTSFFLQDKAVDILQLHLSPMVFGSGKPAITLPKITSVDDALQFKKFAFQAVGDTMMFTGQLS